MQNRIQEVQGLPAKLRLLDDSNLKLMWTGYGHAKHGFFECHGTVGRSQIDFLREEQTRILDNNFIDIPRIRQWVSFCSENHAECSSPHFTSNYEIPNFRVIDVRRRCIISMPSSIKYVALSYVWGQVDTYRLLKSNMNELMKSEGLKRVWTHIPWTVRDAISFTESIGEKYLWVDTLCLIQDDANDMIPGIRHMDSVFGGAFCTLVAASGKDANEGLPGVWSAARRIQHIGVIRPGISVILHDGLDTHLQQTEYDRRAWT
ncbi:hypothetical protein GQ607_002726 [Colletotrichum asianum]|uniref:Heterokaryon incompatibility domain-containing protein n=1 Tax=Colletotrichum asianum TaxID=702518 RepID=A0A8H3WN71_9PEZI|nr:hypothetical protein GQ607_002726 [Colletotrichum asianum]